MKSSWTIPIAIAVGGTIVALAVYISIPKVPSIGGNGNPALVRPVGASDHIFGNPTAPVTIVEYADFDCEYCKEFDETLHQIIANEGVEGKVAWVFRQFPLIEIHPNAMRHAEVAECIAQTAGNDAFWRFKTVLFKNQPIDPSQYGAYAVEAGVSSDSFANCFAHAPTTVGARIQNDRQNALDIGALGTPYSLILVAGKAPVVLNGGYSYDAVRQLITQAVMKAGH